MDVNRDDLAAPASDAGGYRVETHTAGTDDRHRVPGADPRRVEHSTGPGDHTATKQAACGNGISTGIFTSWFSWISACAAKPPNPKAWVTASPDLG